MYNYISYFQLVRKIRALIIEPTSSAASCFNVQQKFRAVEMYGDVGAAVTHLVSNIYGPRTFGSPQLVPN